MDKLTQKILLISLIMTLLLPAVSCAAEEGTTAPQSTSATSSTSAVPGLAGTIVASGSTSMEDLMTALGETFTVINPQVSVEIQGGGSSTGVKNAADGTTDIGNVSRALKDAEKADGLNERIIAIDGLAVAVNPANPAESLTKAQLIGIFTGEITSWKAVGGTDTPIVVILREAGSGTRDGFESILGIADKCVGTQEVNETGIVKSTVAGNVNAIGYLSLGKLDETIKAVAIDGVIPSEATIKDKTYILQRPFLCLTKGEESTLVQAFFQFIYSDQGRALVVKKGYFSVG